MLLWKISLVLSFDMNSSSVIFTHFNCAATFRASPARTEKTVLIWCSFCMVDVLNLSKVGRRRYIKCSSSSLVGQSSVGYKFVKMEIHLHRSGSKRFACVMVVLGRIWGSVLAFAGLPRSEKAVSWTEVNGFVMGIHSLWNSICE